MKTKKIFLFLTMLMLSFQALAFQTITMLSTPLKINDNLTAVAKYEITASVLSVKKYTAGKESDFSEFDFLLGWEKLLQPHIYRNVKVKQDKRWGYWEVDNFDYIKRKEIESMSSNHHIIYSPQTKKIVKQVEKYDIIVASGYLVNVKDGSWNWKTSTSNKDTGDGACEIFYITSIKIL